MVSTTSQRISLQIWALPHGSQLQFTELPDVQAHVFRRSRLRYWECIAAPIRSPYLDATPRDLGTEYQVLYLNTHGDVRAVSSIVAATLEQLPLTTDILHLS